MEIDNPQGASMHPCGASGVRVFRAHQAPARGRSGGASGAGMNRPFFWRGEIDARSGMGCALASILVPPPEAQALARAGIHPARP
jgi:hypothetical protein